MEPPLGPVADPGMLMIALALTKWRPEVGLRAANLTLALRLDASYVGKAFDESRFC
jgi:hypothetical protein